MCVLLFACTNVGGLLFSIQDKGELDCKSTVSYESSELSHIPSSPAHRLSRSQEHLDLPFFPESSLTSCTRSPSHSPSPSEAKKPLAVTVAKEIAQTLLGSMEAPSKPSLCNLQTIMDVLPKGMVQVRNTTKSNHNGKYSFCKECL